MSIQVTILLGAPGAGKGTAAEGVAAATEYVHISTGDMLRSAVRSNQPLGLEAEPFMVEGELVPDDVMLGLIEERLDFGPKDVCYMLDGFPRTLTQARLMDEYFDRRGIRLLKVYFLGSPRDVLVSRLSGRRICRECREIFHVVNIPPKVEGVCDHCQGALYQRKDDSEATIGHRLDVFTSETSSLVDYYESRGVLDRVDADRPFKETNAIMVEKLEQLV